MKSITLVAIITAIVFSSCSTRESITIAGSSTILPIVSKAAEQFKLAHPNIQIIVNGGGSGVGINQVGEGKIDIGLASRKLTREEKKKYPAANFQVHTIAKDGVLPAISSEIYNAGVRALTLRQIGDIYAGKVTNWKTYRGPDRDILAIDKEKSRGTRHVFMFNILGDKEADALGADLVLGSNNEEQTAISQSDAAIGMLSRAWINNDVKGLGIIVAGGVILPTREHIRAGTFPLTRDLDLITRGQPKGYAKTFIDFLLSAEGQKIVDTSGYVSIQ